MLAAAAILLMAGAAAAQVQPSGGDFAVTVTARDGGSMSAALKILLLLTAAAFAPAILISMTSFTRIVVVLSFARHALGTQQAPPNQVLIGLALFLTFFTMGPTIARMDAEAVEPYLAGQISDSEAFGRGTAVLRRFLLSHTRESDLELFYSIGEEQKPASAEDVPLRIAMPAFMLSELKTAFQMGFVLFVPFLLIDLVVSSVLMAMGMMMLPPVLVSLPFKVLLFVLVDGWQLLIGSLAKSFG